MIQLLTLPTEPLCVWSSPWAALSDSGALWSSSHAHSSEPQGHRDSESAVPSSLTSSLEVSEGQKGKIFDDLPNCANDDICTGLGQQRKERCTRCIATCSKVVDEKQRYKWHTWSIAATNTVSILRIELTVGERVVLFQILLLFLEFLLHSAQLSANSL